MKVCFISAYPPNKGYLAEYAEYLISELKKRREIEKILILANKAMGCKRYEEKGKLKVVRCWETNNILTPLYLLREILVLSKDWIIHFNLNMMNWGTRKLVNFICYSLPFFIKLFLRRKVIITLHNLADAINLKRVKFISPSFLNKLGLKIVTKFLLRANKVTVTISYYKKILEKRYNVKNVVHIPHGFPQPVKKIKLTKNKILAFGFWDPRKKLELLIKIFKELKKENQKIELIVAGTSHPKFPNYLEKIKKKFRDNSISFLGYVPQHKVKEVFLNSTLVVLPYTVSVGSSGVLHLAASYGKPVVMTRLPDLVKSIEEENLSVELTTLKDLKNSIKKILQDEKLQRKMIENNLKAAKKLSFKTISKRFITLYEEVLGKSK